jgi:hypothetical protein
MLVGENTVGQMLRRFVTDYKRDFFVVFTTALTGLRLSEIRVSAGQISKMGSCMYGVSMANGCRRSQDI